MEVKAKELTSDGFNAYGKVIEAPETLAPTIENDPISYWKQQAVLNVDGPIEIGVLRVKKYNMVFNQMEKHLQTPEVLIGLDGAFVVPVAKGIGQTPQASQVEAFKVPSGKAILMSGNCWHWTPYPVEKSEVTILVVFKDNTSQNDVIIEDLDQECRIIT